MNMKNKFNIGDKVIIRGDLEIGEPLREWNELEYIEEDFK